MLSYFNGQFLNNFPWCLAFSFICFKQIVWLLSFNRNANPDNESYWKNDFWRGAWTVTM